MTGRLTVLIIEDDALVAMLLTEILQDLGHHVCATAVTEDDAVAAAHRYQPGLMIVDEHLREGTGLAAVERIRRTGSVRCVFISGAPLSRNRQGRTILRKPFSVLDLARAIENTGRDSPAAPANSQAGLARSGHNPSISQLPDRRIDGQGGASIR